MCVLVRMPLIFIWRNNNLFQDFSSRRGLLKTFPLFSTEETCPIPMDTTFIIDASVCDDPGNWNRVLKFVQTLVTFYDVSPSVGRIALITFSTDATVDLKFNTLTGNLLNGEEVNRRVGLLQCQGGSRRIDKALDLAGKEVLTPAGGMRGVSSVSDLLAKVL